ncbi:uncharacterized protein [Epargyreus clarus]
MICKDCSSLLSDVKYLRQVATAHDRQMRALASNGLEICQQGKVKQKQVVQTCREENQVNNGSEDNASSDGSFQIKIERIEDPLSTECDRDPHISEDTPLLVCKGENQTDGVWSRETTSADSSLHIKTEIVENPLDTGSDGDPSMSQAVKGELFTLTPEIESYLEARMTTQWPQLNDVTTKQRRDPIQGYYRCEACAKDFATWKKFYFHNRLHNKSIACPLESCGKKFASKGDLEKHFRTHTGEKPYHCEVCPRRFAQRGTLKAHREAIHKKISEVIIGT